MELNKLFEELADLQQPDIDRHRKKLQYAERVFSRLSTNRTAPTDLLNSYVELTAIIEGYREKNPNLDLAIYDNALMAMRNALAYIEQEADIFQRNEYLETMVATQSRMIADLQTELQQYSGIEQAIMSGTLKDKITTVLKKLRS